MIDITTLETKLKDAFPEATTIVELSRQDDMETIADDPTLTYIKVGWGRITTRHPELPIALDLYNSHGEDLVQIFQVKLACQPNQFREFWIRIYNALVGWNPTFGESSHTGFTYGDGYPIGIKNGYLWFNLIWLIGFPTTTPLEV